jgi:diguanylate cyclase (GGDEF)-like protein
MPMRPGREPINVLAVGLDPGPLEGASVEMADDLLGAMARLADGGIDVVLLSLELPDGQGADAVLSVRERAPDVPVVAVADDGSAHRALEAGAADVLPAGGGSDLVARAVRYAVALHRVRTELHRRDVVDGATGLYNARGFEEFASHHLSLADRTRQSLVLLSIHVEGLGELDQDGGGDGSLVETAAALRAALRDCDVLARTGPGTFCALLTGDAAGAEALVLSRIVDALAVLNARAGHQDRLSLSVGAATYDPEHPTSPQELIARADRGRGS